MNRTRRTLWVAASIAALRVTAGQAQGPQRGRGGAPAAPGGGGRGGGGLAQGMTTPAPTIPNAKAVRTCESLATVALPNTTIESTAVE